MKKIISKHKIVILGSTGLIGGALFDELINRGFRVYGSVSAREKSDDRHLVLDFTNKESIDNFPWKKFDLVIDCIGCICYENSARSLIKNIEINLLGPLKIIEKLGADQHYFYCSSHAVFSKEAQQNPYTISKLFFERAAAQLKYGLPSITILRLPGIFSEKRRHGLLNLIRESFKDRKSIKLDFNSSKWHIMYLPRVVNIIISCIFGKNLAGRTINIGYPVESSIDRIIEIAKDSFGRSMRINLGKKISDHYLPDLKMQNKIYKVTKEDFEDDLRDYFCKP